MTEVTKEMDVHLREISEGIKSVQEVADRNTAESAIDKEQIKRISDANVDALEKLADIEAKNVKFEEALTSLEKIAARPGNGKEVEGICAAKSDFLKYLRRGDAPSLEVQKVIANEIAQKKILGGTTSEIEMMKKSLVEGNNTEGGYWLRQEFADFTVDRLFETSRMRQISRVQTIAGESLQIIVDDDQAEGEWVGETEDRAETATPSIGKNTIYAHELSAFPKASQRMLDDSGFDLEAWLMEKVTDIFGRMENTAFVTGNGAKKPRGFLDYPAWADPTVYQRKALARQVGSVSASFNGDDLIKLQNQLIEDYQPNAVWTMNRRTWETVMTAKTTNGDYLLNPLMLAQGAAKVLLGQPVMFFADMPVSASGSLSVAYGDFRKGYTILDRIGIKVLRDPYTLKPFVAFYTTKRVGGDVTNYQSIKVLQLGA